MKACPGRVDVKRVLAMIKINTDLERIADLCTNIAEHVIFTVTGEIVRHRAKP